MLPALSRFSTAWVDHLALLVNNYYYKNYQQNSVIWFLTHRNKYEKMTIDWIRGCSSHIRFLSLTNFWDLSISAFIELISAEKSPSSRGSKCSCDLWLLRTFLRLGKTAVYCWVDQSAVAAFLSNRTDTCRSRANALIFICRDHMLLRDAGLLWKKRVHQESIAQAPAENLRRRFLCSGAQVKRIEW